ncbi:MAG: hypothetical protein SWH68_02105 [Thermodesulfobacteriota bacterium]|nr:hypothetical protein [Thermodesulfobacteriota bacterium]
MEAIEFKARIKNGVIHVPRKYNKKLGKSVKVILLSDTPGQNTEAIDELLQDPVKLDTFVPSTREDIYER